MSAVVKRSWRHRLAEWIRGDAIPTRNAFTGASVSRLTLDWITSVLSADQEIQNDAALLRSRSRDLCRNTAFGRQYLRVSVANIVGPSGILCEPKLLTATGELDAIANDLLYERWNAWADDPASVSADGRLDLVGVLGQLVTARRQDGEAFLELLPGFPNAWRFATQFWDADQLDHTYNVAPAPGQNEIRQGVEVDSWGRPLGYWMWRRHPNQPTLGNTRIRIAAERMIHWYDPHRPGATRGVPDTASVLLEARMYQGYRDAELVAARASAAKMGFITRTPDDLAGGDAETGGPGTVDADPGTFMRLGIGESFAAWDPQHPVTAFADFCKGIMRNIAAGLGLSYISLSGDLGDTSYSSGRVGLLQEQDEWRTQQRRLVTVLRRIWPVWFAQGRLAGRILLTTKAPVEQVQWRPRSFPWIDPRTEVEATTIELEQGLTSRTRVCAAKGTDFYEILEEIAQEQAAAAQRGVTLGETTAPAAENAPPASPRALRAVG